MTATTTNRNLLLILGLLFFPYGVYCFLVPGFLAEAAGVAATTPTGSTELRAMYGGLQAGFGLLLLAAARDARLHLAAFAALAFLVPGLASTRLIGSFMDGGLSAYTAGALVFEFGITALAVPRLRQALAS